MDPSNQASPLTVSLQHDEQCLTVSGDWTVKQASNLQQSIDPVITQAKNSTSVAIQMRGMRALDTYGALLVTRLLEALAARGQKARVVGLSERYVALLETVRRARAETGAALIREQPGLSKVARVGKSVSDAGETFASLLNMLGAVCESLVRVARNPSTFRMTSTIHQLDRVGWQAVPIVFLITFLIGSIIAQQGFFHFRKFGADDYVVDMVGILVLREIGVLIVAIMVAGRSGSSYTAELGSMKMREEIDALRTMGFDPVEVLVLPRVIALVIALPILAFLGSMAALYGAELVAWLYGGMSPDIFTARLKDAISITHFKVGMTKAPFMALVIGIVACAKGFEVAGSAESLGLQTTTSVVTSIFLVIVLDGLFAIFFASIGM